MTRERDQRRLEQIGGYVQAHPGVRPAEIARELNVPRSAVTRALPGLEDAGLLSHTRSKIQAARVAAQAIALAACATLAGT